MGAASGGPAAGGDGRPGAAAARLGFGEGVCPEVLAGPGRPWLCCQAPSGRRRGSGVARAAPGRRPFRRGRATDAPFPARGSAAGRGEGSFGKMAKLPLVSACFRPLPSCSPGAELGLYLSLNAALATLTFLVEAQAGVAIPVGAREL